MDTIATGVISSIEKGHFDGAHNVEITLLDGTKLTGYDGITVYETRKSDGQPTKVWPLVKKSFADGVPFSWKGNINAKDVRGKQKVYASLVFAEGSDGGGSATPNGGSSGTTPPAAAGTPPPSDASGWGSPPPSNDWGQRPVETVADPTLSKDDYWRRKEETDEQRTREIEAAWAIGLLINNVEPDKLHQEVHRLIVFKHQVARELGE